MAKKAAGTLMKIGLYSPYIPKHFGGGEKHMLTSAWYLSQQHDVEVLIPSSACSENEWRPKYESLFGLDLSRVQFVPSPLADHATSPLGSWQITRQYDAFLYLTDGSLFLAGSKNTILHIQVPYTFAKNGLIERVKLWSWHKKNANSHFTREIVQRAWKTPIQYLHYPYVRLPEQLDLQHKTQDIIGVGRFIAPGHSTHSKGQEVLIQAFMDAQKNGFLSGSTLHLVGTIEPGAEAFVAELEQLAFGARVRFYHDISQSELEELYDRCSLFWHAAGWNIDETANPEKVEHFGMATIEAMAHGCIPIVLEKGGSKEIIQQHVNGFFFTTPEELATLSVQILSDPSSKQQLQEAAVERASDFSLERFCHTLDEMVGSA